MAFTIDDMRKCATEAWGPLGSNAVERWQEFNQLYFANQLRPIPLVITNAQPFGKRLAFCSWGCGRTITLNVPKLHKRLLADNGVLLHEMCHQCLYERDEDPAHTSAGWRNEIMRLHEQITGHTIWAGRSTTARRKIGDVSKVVRINKPNAETGQLSLRQGEIARWPHSCGVSLGELGRNAMLKVTNAT